LAIKFLFDRTTTVVLRVVEVFLGCFLCLGFAGVEFCVCESLGTSYFGCVRLVKVGEAKGAVI
jgi:CO dehydrogenase/acetyl-CoA synthase beta subunit